MGKNKCCLKFKKKGKTCKCCPLLANFTEKQLCEKCDNRKNKLKKKKKKKDRKK